MFDSVNSYYKVHSKIYDLTRWSILFGRNDLLSMLPSTFKPKTILDLGCGTGKHLLKLSELFPEAHITGVDESKEMLAKASAKTESNDRIKLVHNSFRSYLNKSENFDLILCSYSLSMLENKAIDLQLIYDSLNENGLLAVVDFDNTPLPIFEQWMNLNHVQISGNLFNHLNKVFYPRDQKTKAAYFRLWKYTLFLGSK